MPIFDRWEELHGIDPDEWPDLEIQERREDEEDEEWWDELEDEKDP